MEREVATDKGTGGIWFQLISTEQDGSVELRERYVPISTPKILLGFLPS